MICKNIFYIFLCVLLFSSCVSKKHSVKTNTKTVTDSIAKVNIRHDTLSFHGVRITDEVITIVTSQWNASDSTWSPRTKTDISRNTKVENADTTSVSVEQTITEVQQHEEQKQQEKEVTQQGVRWNILDAIACALGAIVVLLLLFGPKNRLK